MAAKDNVHTTTIETEPRQIIQTPPPAHPRISSVNEQEEIDEPEKDERPPRIMSQANMGGEQTTEMTLRSSQKTKVIPATEANPIDRIGSASEQGIPNTIGIASVSPTTAALTPTLSSRTSTTCVDRCEHAGIEVRRTSFESADGAEAIANSVVNTIITETETNALTPQTTAASTISMKSNKQNSVDSLNTPTPPTSFSDESGRTQSHPPTTKKVTDGTKQGLKGQQKVTRPGFRKASSTAAHKQQHESSNNSIRGVTRAIRSASSEKNRKTTNNVDKSSVISRPSNLRVSLQSGQQSDHLSTEKQKQNVSIQKRKSSQSSTDKVSDISGKRLNNSTIPTYPMSMSSVPRKKKLPEILSSISAASASAKPSSVIATPHPGNENDTHQNNDDNAAVALPTGADNTVALSDSITTTRAPPKDYNLLRTRFREHRNSLTTSGMPQCREDGVPQKRDALVDFEYIILEGKKKSGLLHSTCGTSVESALGDQEEQPANNDIENNKPIQIAEEQYPSALNSSTAIMQVHDGDTQQTMQFDPHQPHHDSNAQHLLNDHRDGFRGSSPEQLQSEHPVPVSPTREFPVTEKTIRTEIDSSEKTKDQAFAELRAKFNALKVEHDSLLQATTAANTSAGSRVSTALMTDRQMMVPVLPLTPFIDSGTGGTGVSPPQPPTPITAPSPMMLLPTNQATSQPLHFQQHMLFPQQQVSNTTFQHHLFPHHHHHHQSQQSIQDTPAVVFYQHQRGHSPSVSPPVQMISFTPSSHHHDHQLHHYQPQVADGIQHHAVRPSSPSVTTSSSIAPFVGGLSPLPLYPIAPNFTVPQNSAPDRVATATENATQHNQPQSNNQHNKLSSSNTIHSQASYGSLDGPGAERNRHTQVREMTPAHTYNEAHVSDAMIEGTENGRSSIVMTNIPFHEKDVSKTNTNNETTHSDHSSNAFPPVATSASKLPVPAPAPFDLPPPRTRGSRLLAEHRLRRLNEQQMAAAQEKMPTPLLNDSVTSLMTISRQGSTDAVHNMHQQYLEAYKSVSGGNKTEAPLKIGKKMVDATTAFIPASFEESNLRVGTGIGARNRRQKKSVDVASILIRPESRLQRDDERLASASSLDRPLQAPSSPPQSQGGLLSGGFNRNISSSGLSSARPLQPHPPSSPLPPPSLSKLHACGIAVKATLYPDLGLQLNTSTPLSVSEDMMNLRSLEQLLRNTTTATGRSRMYHSMGVPKSIGEEINKFGLLASASPTRHSQRLASHSVESNNRFRTRDDRDTSSSIRVSAEASNHFPGATTATSNSRFPSLNPPVSQGQESASYITQSAGSPSSIALSPLKPLNEPEDAHALHSGRKARIGGSDVPPRITSHLPEQQPTSSMSPTAPPRHRSGRRRLTQSSTGVFW